MVGALLPLISRAPPFQRKAFHNASQRAISYPAGAFVGGASNAKVGPGMRAPEAPLDIGKSIYDRISGYGFTALILSRRPLSSAETEQVEALGIPTHSLRVRRPARVPARS
ncbi:hypothetical protein [Sphingomonas sp. LT1P40]|uniref:hypothetical protein n=1 Tax=Alteristakelama amylovorans TaxID=3096166 RepID=UPI002FC88662